jgi:lantibiotic modifying enzyme
MALVIERAERNGYYSCTTRSIKSVFSPNLFYGVAGIGFEMYRLAFPDETESILL